MKRTIFTFIFCLFTFASLVAQDIVFKCEVPKVVGLHERFRVSFTINSSEARNFIAPTFQNVNILSGPSTSRSSSVSIVNGKRTDNSSITFSYWLQSLTTGKIFIPSAQVRVAGKLYTTQPTTIKVEDNPSMSQRAQNNPNAPQNSQASQAKVKVIDDKAVFVRAIPSKTKAVVGEEIVISYKIYTLVPISEYQVDKFPTSQGFWVEELDEQAAPQLEKEMHDGKMYQVATLRKVLVYPQRAGKLNIQPMGLEVVAHLQTGTSRRQRVSTGDPFFDAFFNDPFFSHSSPIFERVNKKLKTNALTIEVTELPKTNKDFSGAVGQFEISSSIDTSFCATNEAITLNYTISGRGNLSLIDALNINIPDEFEVYEPNISDELSKSEAGQRGKRTFQYIIIPRVEGNYIIPPLEFTYFNTNSGKYETLRTDSYNLKIQKGKSDNGFAEQLSERERYRNMYIKDVFPSKASRSVMLLQPFSSPIIYMVVALLLLALVIMILLTRRQIVRNSDIVASKLRKANKVAMKRLKKARLYLLNNQKEEFETEIGQALWSYLSDKFKIATYDLNSENIRKALCESSLEESLLEQTIQTLSDCEYIRFSQNKNTNTHQELFDKTLKTITDIENHIVKIKKQSSKSKLGFITLLLCVCSLGAAAQSLNEAKSAYERKDFGTAIEIYLKSSEVTPNAEIYHAIANTYFRMSDYANAILYYERAIRLSPNDQTLITNYKVCRSRLMGEVYVMPDFFLLRWIDNMSKWFSPLTWAIIFCVLLFGACGCFFVYYFSSEHKVLLFYLSLALFILSLSSFGLGSHRQNTIHSEDYAIVFSADIPLKENLSDNTDSRTKLFKGQKVKIEERSGEQLRVKTEDGKEGWIDKNVVKII